MTGLVVLVAGYAGVWYFRAFMLSTGLWRVVVDVLSVPALACVTVLGLVTWGHSLLREVSSVDAAGVALDGLALTAMLLTATVMAGISIGRGPWWLFAAVALAVTSYRLGRRRVGGSVVDRLVGEDDVRVVSPEAMRRMAPRDFELLVARVLEDQGWSDVRHTGGPHDRGADILAVDPDGFPVLVQCKRFGADNAVGSAEVRALMGAAVMIHECRRLLVVTTGRFTPDVRQLAQERPEALTLWDADILTALSQLPLRS